MSNQHNDLTEILSQALNEIKSEMGDQFSLEKINLAELERRTGISRARLRHIKENGFTVQPHALIGRKANTTVLTGFTCMIDALLRRGVKNSSVIFDRLIENGYTGGKTSVKTYIREHKHLLPPKRQMVAPRGNRGRRYETAPGECYQMDWGFVNVETASGDTYKVACFAMICHACGKRYIEFFPNAKQENLFLDQFLCLKYRFLRLIFYRKHLPFIIRLSQKNAPFRNILLLRVRYISIFNFSLFVRIPNSAIFR